MKITITVIILFLFMGCAMLEKAQEAYANLSPEAQAQLEGNIVSGVNTAIQAIPLPAPVDEPVKGVLEWLTYTLVPLALGALGFKKLKDSKEGKMLG